MRFAILLAFSLALTASARAQGATERPPLLSGNWVGIPGSLYFNFIHRFSESGAPERKVSSFPTFVLGASLPWNSLVGVSYATNSSLVPRYPNEHEYFLRLTPYAQSRGGLFDFGFQAGYNDAARGADGEATLARQAGPLRLISAARVLKGVSDGSGTDVAVAGGVVLRLTRYIALAGDVGGLTKREPDEKLAWSAGLQLQIPLTPHTLSLHATNVNTNTLQGTSRGADRVRYGFEFTIPVTLRRYFGPRATPPPAQAAPPEPNQAPRRITIAHAQGMAFRPARIEISAGTTVEWKNDDPLPHTVTATDGSFASPLIEPGQTWRRTFDKPGEYAFYCTPHPFMRGVVVVR